MSNAVRKIIPIRYTQIRDQGSSKSRKWSYAYISNELKFLKDRVSTLEKNNEPSVEYLSTEIFGVILEGFVLNHPLTVSLEIYPNEAIAIIPNLNLYGNGTTESDAIADLKLELIDLYEDLNSIPDKKLGKELLACKKTVNQLIKSA